MLQERLSGGGRKREIARDAGASSIPRRRFSKASATEQRERQALASFSVHRSIPLLAVRQTAVRAQGETERRMFQTRVRRNTRGSPGHKAGGPRGSEFCDEQKAPRNHRSTPPATRRTPDA